jgi:hypothetical protein
MRRRTVSMPVPASVPTFHMNEHGEQTDLPRTHPRFSFSLHRKVKAELSISDRIELCEDLAPYLAEALTRYPDNPLTVEVWDMILELCEHAHPDKSGRVMVNFPR